VTEIRNLVLKNSDLISNYYVQYIAGYDAPLLSELSQRFNGGTSLSEYEQLLIHSCIQAMANILGLFFNNKTIFLIFSRWDRFSRCSFRLVSFSVINKYWTFNF
jgi:hypothetical protein